MKLRDGRKIVITPRKEEEIVYNKEKEAISFSGSEGKMRDFGERINEDKK